MIGLLLQKSSSKLGNNKRTLSSHSNRHPARNAHVTRVKMRKKTIRIPKTLSISARLPEMLA